MKIIEIKSLQIPDIKVIRFGRFFDRRGFFSETFRRSDFKENAQLSFINGYEFLQVNESYSRAGVMRGLHMQWNPGMGKLVRTVSGRMVDLALDIRKGSPYYGQIVAYDMPQSMERDFDEWIWIPPGFAHGNYFTEDTRIQYFCTSQYAPGNEGCISLFDREIDWRLMAGSPLKAEFDDLADSGEAMLSDKDRQGITLLQWPDSKGAEHFTYV